MSAHANEMSVPAASDRGGDGAIGGARRAGVVAVYAVAFFGALPLVLWTLGGRLDVLLHLPRVEALLARRIGAALAASGAALTAWSMLSLSLRGRGLPISHLPPSMLVVRGPHAWTRHPIYVGFAWLFAGFGIASGSLGRGVFATLLLAAGSAVYAVGFEEPRLRARFGAVYVSYAERVPAFPFTGLIARAVDAVWARVRRPAERLANRVVLFRVGPAIVVSYGAFGALGACVGLGTAHVLLGAALGVRDEAIYLAGVAISIVVWARLVGLLYQARLLVRDPREALRRVGFVSWGGYVGLFSFPFVFASVLPHGPHDALWLLDRSFVAALACSCLGRIGCLTYGCCYGRPSPTGIAWTNPDAKPNRELCTHGSVPRVATQLLSAAYAAAIIPVVVSLLARSAPGAATVVGALSYATARFAVECLRDEPRFTRLQLTRGQMACGIGAALAMVAALLVPDRPAVDVGASASSSAYGWVAVIGASVMTFVVYGVHFRRVGRW